METAIEIVVFLIYIVLIGIVWFIFQKTSGVLIKSLLLALLLVAPKIIIEDIIIEDNYSEDILVAAFPRFFGLSFGFIAIGFIWNTIKKVYYEYIADERPSQTTQNIKSNSLNKNRINSEIQCSNCGYSLLENSKYCPNCDTNLNLIESNKMRPNTINHRKRIAIVLTVGVGGFILGIILAKVFGFRKLGEYVAIGLGNLGILLGLWYLKDLYFAYGKNFVAKKSQESNRRKIRNELLMTKELFDKNILTQEEYDKQIKELKQELL